MAPKTTRSLRSVRARLGEGRGGGVPVRLARASVGHKSALALMNLSQTSHYKMRIYIKQTHITCRQCRAKYGWIYNEKTTHIITRILGCQCGMLTLRPRYSSARQLAAALARLAARTGELRKVVFLAPRTPPPLKYETDLSDGEV